MSKAHIDVRYVAKLARLDLSEEEVILFQSQLESILGHVESLSALKLSDEQIPTNMMLLGKMRDDIPHQSLDSSAVLLNSPDQAHLQIRVPKVVADA